MYCFGHGGFAVTILVTNVGVFTKLTGSPSKNCNQAFARTVKHTTVVLGAHGYKSLDAGRAPSGGAKLKANIREAGKMLI